MAVEQHKCPTCGTVKNAYWHRLSPGLVETLIKIRRAVGEKNENSVHLLQDLKGRNALSPTQYSNAQKLRFHGMIRHDDDGKSGYWSLNKRAAEFLTGQLDVPYRVKTLDNQVVDHDERHVTIDQVMGELPKFDDHFRFGHEAEAQPLNLTQGVLL